MQQLRGELPQALTVAGRRGGDDQQRRLRRAVHRRAAAREGGDRDPARAADGRAIPGRIPTRSPSPTGTVAQRRAAVPAVQQPATWPPTRRPAVRALHVHSTWCGSRARSGSVYSWTTVWRSADPRVQRALPPDHRGHRTRAGRSCPTSSAASTTRPRSGCGWRWSSTRSTTGRCCRTSVRSSDARRDRDHQPRVPVDAELIDGGDYEGIGALFTDAVIGAERVHGRMARRRGDHRDVRERQHRRYEDGTPRSKHVTTNLIIEVARARPRHLPLVLHGVAADRRGAAPTHRRRPLPRRVRSRRRRVALRPPRMFVDLVGDLSKHLLFELRRPHLITNRRRPTSAYAVW